MLTPPIQDKRHWWHREDLILLVLLGILYLLPGLHKIPLFDRDEPRFAVAARTMMETGDYIVPHFNGALRPDKPPLVYWLMDIGYLLTGGPSELGARLPSAFCATMSLLVVYFMTGRRFGRLTGFLAAMMLGTCALFLAEGRFATADATMLLTIVGCMACAWQAWDAAAPSTSGQIPRADFLPDRTGDRMPLLLDNPTSLGSFRVPLSRAILFWVSLAAGTLTKGVPLLFVFVPMIVLSLATGALPGELRQWRSHFHLTRLRVRIALAIASAVAIFLIAATSVHAQLDGRLSAAVLGTLLIGMVLTPGLPGVLGRCLWHGNWTWWRALRPLIGFPLLVLLVGWWVLLAGMATHWQLLIDMVGNHFLNRSAGPLLHWLGIKIPDTTIGGTQDPMKAYGQPPGFYLATVWATFWPWSIFIVPAAFHTFRRLRGKTPIAIDPRPYQFLLAWIIPMWIALELARGKLFHYPLPLFVPLAILCADTLVQSWHRLTDVLEAPWFHAMRWITLFIWVGIGMALLFITRSLPDRDLFWRTFPFAVALMATGFVSAFTWGKHTWPYVLVLGWGGSLLVANTILLPDMPELQVSRIAGRTMAHAKDANPDYHLAVCGFEEATLVFYSGSNVERLELATLLRDVPFAPAADPASKPYVITIDTKLLETLDKKGLRYARLPRVDLPDNLRNTEAYTIAGINPNHILNPVNVTVISNILPPPASHPETDPQE